MVGGTAKGELCLRRSRRGSHQPEAVGMCHAVAAGHIDHADHLARGGIVDRRRRTGPVLHGVPEVFGGEYLHLVIQCESRARCIGPGVRLVPGGTLDEVHRFGAAPRTRVSLDPQQASGRVTDDHEVLAVVGDAAHEIAQHGHDVVEGVRGTIDPQVVAREHDRWTDRTASPPTLPSIRNLPCARPMARARRCGSAPTEASQPSIAQS